MSFLGVIKLRGWKSCFKLEELFSTWESAVQWEFHKDHVERVYDGTGCYVTRIKVRRLVLGFWMHWEYFPANNLPPDWVDDMGKWTLKYFKLVFDWNLKRQMEESRKGPLLKITES